MEPNPKNKINNFELNQNLLGLVPQKNKTKITFLSVLFCRMFLECFGNKTLQSQMNVFGTKTMIKKQTKQINKNSILFMIYYINKMYI